MVVIKKSEADLQNTHSVTSMAWPSTAPGGRAGLDNSLLNICSCQQQFLRSKSRSHSLDGAAWAVKDEGAGAGGACHIYGQGRGTNSQKHTKTTKYNKYNEVQFEQRRVFTILNLQLKQCCPNLFIIPATTAAFTWQVRNSKFPILRRNYWIFAPSQQLTISSRSLAPALAARAFRCGSCRTTCWWGSEAGWCFICFSCAFLAPSCDSALQKLLKSWVCDSSASLLVQNVFVALEVHHAWQEAQNARKPPLKPSIATNATHHLSTIKHLS